MTDTTMSGSADTKPVDTPKLTPGTDAPVTDRGGTAVSGQSMAPVDTDDGDDLGFDAPAERSTEDAPKTLWPTRPEGLKTEDEIADWKAETGLPDRDSYELPDLGEGRAFTEYGEEMATKILDITYGLDLPTAAAQQLVARGAAVIEQMRAERDAADKTAATDDMAEAMGEAGARDQVAAGRAYLKSLGDFGKVLQQARGPDGRRLAYSPAFWEWASSLHDTGATMEAGDAAPRSNAADTRDDAKLRKELADTNALLRSDRDAYHTELWRESGMTASDRNVQIRVELGKRASGHRGPSEAQRQAAVAQEVKELQRLERVDPERFEYAPWRNSKLTGVERLNQIARAGR